MQHASCHIRHQKRHSKRERQREGERWQKIKIATFYWVVSCVKHMQILPHMYSTATPSNNNTHTHTHVILDSSRTPKKNLAASIAHMPALELRLSKPMRCWFPTPQRRLPPPATPPVPVPLTPPPSPLRVEAEVKGNLYEFYACVLIRRRCSRNLQIFMLNILYACVCVQWVWQPNTLAIFIDFSHVRPPNEAALRIDCITNFAQCSAENVFRIIWLKLKTRVIFTCIHARLNVFEVLSRPLYNGKQKKRALKLTPRV